MRTILLSLLTVSISACATSSVEDSSSSHGGSGGKGDEWVTECPIAGGADKVLAAIEDARTCGDAAGIAYACRGGISNDQYDLGYVNAATELCAANFGGMTTQARADYNSLLARCDAKFDDSQGTRGISHEAYCQLEATKAFEHIYSAGVTNGTTEYERNSCPVDTEDTDAVSEAVSGAWSCTQSMQTAEACTTGFAFDVIAIEAASEYCQADYSASDAALRERMVTRCEDANVTDGSAIEWSGQIASAWCVAQTDLALDAILRSFEEGEDPVHDPADPINQ